MRDVGFLPHGEVPAPFDEVLGATVGGIRIHQDLRGTCPDLDFAEYDLCLTENCAAARPWVVVRNVAAVSAKLERRISATPVAAGILAELLRIGGGLPRLERLTLESLAYSTLLAGREFCQWLRRRASAPASAPGSDPVTYARNGDQVTLILSSPETLNAYSAAMRDALVEYLDTCILDPTEPTVRLCGVGESFCTGGALGEFGLATDLAAAHVLRLKRSAVTRLWRLGEHAHARVHGPVIGSGLEIACAAPTVVAHRRAWFQLPELTMGLIPGAGGTVTVVDRIGRHRTLWMLLSGVRIRAEQALSWGLVDALDSA
jgi:hypothetical protein